MKKTKDKTHKPRRKQWFWILAILPLALVGAGMLMCNHTPRAYQPAPADTSDEVSTYLTHELGPDFFNNIQLDQPFDLIVRQEGINEILTNEALYEDFGDFSYADPMIVFDVSKIYLMGTLKYKGISSVVTIIAEPVMDASGKINMNIQSIRMGVLPVTKLVAFLAQKAFDMSRDEFEGEEDIAVVTQAIIRNEPFDPVFEVSGSTARISDFTLSPGLLTLRFQPIPQTEN